MPRDPSIPHNDPEQLLAEIRELQAGTVFQNAEIKVLRRVLLEELPKLGVHTLDGKPIRERYAEMIDEEIRTTFAKMADRDPTFASFLQRFLDALRQRAENETRDTAG